MARTSRWIKGNTHTHTTYSDGDSPPEVVVDWYATHGYDFVFLTDHNAVIPADHLQRLQGRGLAVWQGEELTMGVVHVNGLGLQHYITPLEAVGTVDEPRAVQSRAERIRWSLEQVARQDAVPSVNHPNRWATLEHDEVEQAIAAWLAGAVPARLESVLLEIANMSPESVRNDGDLFRPTCETLWDRLLTAGKRIWAVASDDAHHFRSWGPERCNPGRGWIMVETKSTSLSAALAALRAGRFYASTGPELADYRASSRELDVELASGPACLELIGPGGRVLEAVEGTAVRFSLPRCRGSYVRVRVTAPDGGRLWTQPHEL